MKKLYCIFFSLSLCFFAEAQDKLSTRLENHVRYLSEIQPDRSYRNLESLNKAADYIKNKMQSYGLKTDRQKFQTRGNTYQNIVAKLGPKNAEMIVIGAHYDSATGTPGADDNASGVAGLIELARLLKQKEESLTKRYELVAYSLEEPPFFASLEMGSYIHAKSLSENKIKVKAMVSLEMIGYFSDEAGSQAYPLKEMKELYPDRGNFVAVISSQKNSQLVTFLTSALKSHGSLPVCGIAAPVNIPGIDYSDHRNYWAFNYPAVMITDTAFYRNPHYHLRSDTAETLDYNKMGQVVEGLYHSLLSEFN